MFLGGGDLDVACAEGWGQAGGEGGAGGEEGLGARGGGGEELGDFFGVEVEALIFVEGAGVEVGLVVEVGRLDGDGVELEDLAGGLVAVEVAGGLLEGEGVARDEDGLVEAADELREDHGEVALAGVEEGDAAELSEVFEAAEGFEEEFGGPGEAVEFGEAVGGFDAVGGFVAAECGGLAGVGPRYGGDGLAEAVDVDDVAFEGGFGEDFDLLGGEDGVDSGFEWRDDDDGDAAVGSQVSGGVEEHGLVDGLAGFGWDVGDDGVEGVGWAEGLVVESAAELAGGQGIGGCVSLGECDGEGVAVEAEDFGGWVGGGEEDGDGSVTAAEVEDVWAGEVVGFELAEEAEGSGVELEGAEAGDGDVEGEGSFGGGGVDGFFDVEVEEGLAVGGLVGHGCLLCCGGSEVNDSRW